MVDGKSRVPNPLFLREEDLRQTIELLFFAYRDFTEGPDKILAEVGFGRAHHRVINFVFRNEGISVTELLRILKITKQSLSRVLTQLVNDGYIDQIQGTKDRRQKRLYLTEKGLSLEKKLSEPHIGIPVFSASFMRKEMLGPSMSSLIISVFIEKPVLKSSVRIIKSGPDSAA